MRNLSGEQEWLDRRARHVGVRRPLERDLRDRPHVRVTPLLVPRGRESLAEEPGKRRLTRRGQANGVNSLRRPDRATIVVTHYQRLLDYIVPDFVHVLADGQIVKSGGKELALELEAKGYEWLTGVAEAAA